MGATLSSDFVFEPKVWADHVMAYFDDKLVYGAFALQNRELVAEGSGLVVNFPYYQSIGAAEEPEENESLQVDNLTDDSFNVTVKEIGKAVGIKKKAFKKSADRVAGIVSEAQRQIGRVMAEKVDLDLNAEISDPANYEAGYTASAAAGLMSVNILLEAKIVAFGDKADEAEVCFMHPLQYLDLAVNATTGFLKADANDPLFNVKGFMGRLFGMAIVVANSVKKHADIDGLDAYRCTFHKVNSYGFMIKQDPEMEEDKDILARERLYAGTQWYGVKSFHAKIASDDLKAGACITTISKADGVA